GSAAGFDDVRVERALDQEVDGRVRTLDRSLLLDRLRDRPLEGADELAADDLALGLRVGDAGEVPEVGLGLVERDEARADRRHEVVLDLLPLPRTQQRSEERRVGKEWT